jgi:hypothetical protein
VRAVAMGHQLLQGQGRRLSLRSPSWLAAQVLDVFGLTDLIESAAPDGQGADFSDRELTTR